MVDTTETVEVETKMYGTMQVSIKQKIIFEEGLYGFEKLSVFYLLDTEDGGPFYYLQSGEDKDLLFILINPYIFKKDFVLDVRKEDLNKIGISKEEDAEKMLVFSIVTILENSKGMTANLLGPILINTDKKVGIQALSLVEGYSTKHNILEEMKNTSEEGE